MAVQRAELGREKQEAYQWIRATTAPTTRLIAYDAAALYIHTGRQALRPMAFSTEAFCRKDEQVLAHDLMFDSACAIRDHYWLMAEGDHRLETGRPLIDQRIAGLKASLPVAFSSSCGRVRVYEVRYP